jgi:ATP-dependent Clp protease ATP-binding subunit ClpA
MFEKFAADTRQTFVAALAEARKSGTHRIGCEHLLIGLARLQSGPAADALAATGLSVPRLRELAVGKSETDRLDADSLAAVGIDLDAVRRAAEEAFGPGALDQPGRNAGRASGRTTMTSGARKAMELARRAAQAGHSRSISSGHVLIAIIDQGDNGAIRMLAAAKVRPDELRADTARRMASAA